MTGAGGLHDGWRSPRRRAALASGRLRSQAPEKLLEERLSALKRVAELGVLGPGHLAAEVREIDREKLAQ